MICECVVCGFCFVGSVMSRCDVCGCVCRRGGACMNFNNTFLAQVTHDQLAHASIAAQGFGAIAG